MQGLREPSHRTTNVLLCNIGVIFLRMMGAQFKRWLAKQGCTFEPGKGGHLKVWRGDQKSVLPMHGSGKELKLALVNGIKKDLGLR